MEYKKDISNNKTLHLVLKRKWWDMIESCEKKEEYRDVNRYWAVRLIDRKYHSCFDQDDFVNGFLSWLYFNKLDYKMVFCNHTAVCFHMGYTNNTMTFRITSIKVMYGVLCRQDWGAEPDKYYFVIKLGKRIG